MTPDQCLGTSDYSPEERCSFLNEAAHAAYIPALEEHNRALEASAAAAVTAKAASKQPSAASGGSAAADPKGSAKPRSTNPWRQQGRQGAGAKQRKREKRAEWLAKKQAERANAAPAATSDPLLRPPKRSQQRSPQQSLLLHLPSPSCSRKLLPRMTARNCRVPSRRSFPMREPTPWPTPRTSCRSDGGSRRGRSPRWACEGADGEPAEELEEFEEEEEDEGEPSVLSPRRKLRRLLLRLHDPAQALRLSGIERRPPRSQMPPLSTMG